MRLSEHIYRTVSSLAGHLLFVRKVFSSRIGEVAKIIAPDGRVMEGEVLKIEGEVC